MGAQVGLQAVAIRGAGLRSAEARQSEPEPADARLGQQRREQDDRLCVERGVVGAERLGPHLPELAIAARLGALVSEEARQVPELHWLAALVHAVLDVGAADRCGPLWTQRKGPAAGVLEGEHLLAHDVGRLPDGAGEQLGGLEGRRLDALVSRAL